MVSWISLIMTDISREDIKELNADTHYNTIMIRTDVSRECVIEFHVATYLQGQNVVAKLSQNLMQPLTY